MKYPAPAHGCSSSFTRMSLPSQFQPPCRLVNQVLGLAGVMSRATVLMIAAVRLMKVIWARVRTTAGLRGL